ncbi:hypothetical protein [Microseira wollei]|uniref:Uncharacterized protein n=1 Tax=Microseira wollei NIES-4236 TaxID=2530354 RepID=A0AAV3XS59_9CYAN|nr:hypothetical protein [Microseira wollei]GET43871.1 hypothetical protein MiSe_86970 [Microseira wollei NIES-4236]
MKINLQVYAAAIIATAFLLVIWQVMGEWQFSITVEPPEAELPPVPTSSEVLPVTKPASNSASNSTPAPTLTQPLAATNPAKARSKAPATAAGTLRVSNQTTHPVRLALLPVQSTAKSGKQPAYGVPAHWDFAPAEGGSRGLVLALPDGNLKLNRGDVLVAFAQDGSSRYWGPYVVGETGAPVWNNQRSEWQLILQP